MKNRIKEANCPRCGKKLYRRHTNKSTKCNYCNFLIVNTHEVFKPRQQKY